MRLLILKGKFALNIAHIQFVVRDDEDDRAIKIYWAATSALIIRYKTTAERDADFFRAIKKLNRKTTTT